jgi:hypothetical protein
MLWGWCREGHRGAADAGSCSRAGTRRALNPEGDRPPLAKEEED